MTTRIYDRQTEFSATEAAKLISGAYDNDQKQDSYQSRLTLLLSSYEIALQHFRKISDSEEPWSSRQPPPTTSLQSVAMQQCVRLLEIDPRGATFTAWLTKHPSTVKEQKFGREELQRWVEARDLESEYQFLSLKVADESGTTPTSPISTEIDYTLLATREELISTFGPATGMDLGWFKTLKDSQGLLAARRVKGRGQRGRTQEPLFCPYAIMQWLIDPKRRRGRKLTSKKGWDLLERNFPRVYAQYSIGDPGE